MVFSFSKLFSTNCASPHRICKKMKSNKSSWTTPTTLNIPLHSPLHAIHRYITSKYSKATSLANKEFKCLIIQKELTTEMSSSQAFLIRVNIACVLNKCDSALMKNLLLFSLAKYSANTSVKNWLNSK